MSLLAKHWRYEVLSAFSEAYYKDLLLKNAIVGNRQPIKLGGKDSPATVVYVLQKNKKLYAINEDLAVELPMLVLASEQVTYGRNVYDYVTNYQTARFKPEHNHSFKELVDEFLPFKHSNPVGFLLWKIIVLASYMSRLNVRVATEAGFGKDSAVKCLNALFGDVAVIQNPTIAKLEYCLVNKVLMLNECVNLNSEEKRHMEQFFLSTGDLSNFYTKRSRATQEGTETYDISKLSLLLCYNSRDHYPEGTEYFDDMFQSAVKDRFLPLQLTGKLLEEFGSDNNPLATADLVKPDFVRFIRSVEWWKQHHQDTKSVNYEHGLKGRWKASADRIIQFIKLYAQDNHDLFVSLVEELVSANKRYLGIESSEKNSLPPVTLDVVSWRDVS